MKRLILGTRGSQLARTQSQQVADQLQQANPEVAVELKIIRTAGDIEQTKPLPEIGGKGLFTEALDKGLLEGSIDIAVHSMKDLPTDETPGLEIVSVPLREKPHDVLLSREGKMFLELAAGARVGTGSLRRLAQLRYLRPDLEFRDIRGNVDTRIRKMREGEYEAIVLAAAGLRRLGMAERIDEQFETNRVLPAVGQGALAITGRVDDTQVRDIVERISDRSTVQAVVAERAMLQTLGGGCHVPIAAHAQASGEQVGIEGLGAAPDGSKMIRDQMSGSAEEAELIGRRLGEKLLQAGAGEILDAFE